MYRRMILQTVSFQVLVTVSILVMIHGCANVQKRWEDTELRNTIESYEQFISEYPESKEADQAQKRIRELRYSQAINEDSIESYEQYTNPFLGTQEATSADLLPHDMQYRLLYGNWNIKKFRDFLEQYPYSPHKREIIHAIELLSLKPADRDRRLIDSIKTIHLVIEDAPTNIPPIHKITSEVLKLFGWELIDNQNTRADAQIYVTLFAGTDLKPYAQNTQTGCYELLIPGYFFGIIKGAEPYSLVGKATLEGWIFINYGGILEYKRYANILSSAFAFKICRGQPDANRLIEEAFWSTEYISNINGRDKLLSGSGFVEELIETLLDLTTKTRNQDFKKKRKKFYYRIKNHFGFIY